jgi:hypothetical protein
LTQPALGHGGAGRGIFVFAILDHSYDLSDEWYAWDCTDIELFHKLVQVAGTQSFYYGPTITTSYIMTT